MNLLVLTPLVPYPPHDGDKLRLYHFLEQLKKRGHRIDLFCLTRAKEDLRPSAALLRLCRRVHVERLSRADLLFNALGALMTSRSMNVFSYFSPRFRDALRAYAASPEGARVDRVLAHRLRMAPYAFGDGPARPVVLELTDSMSLVSSLLRDTRGIRASRRVASFWDKGILDGEEVRWVSRSSASVLVSPVDAEHLRSRGAAPDKLHVVPNGLDFSSGTGPRPREYGRGVPVAAFVGNMGYPPNEDGALWFLAKVWPLLKRKFPDAVFVAAGGRPRRALGRKDNGTDVRVTGTVPSIEPYVRNADLTVAPLRVASGMQNKVALSLAMGVPVVATPGAVSWLPPDVRKGILQAQDPEGFAEAAKAVLARPGRARSAARKAGAFIRRTYRWDKAGAALNKILRDAVSHRASSGRTLIS